MPKPNLFNYATKELSQDAIICWLIEWAGTQAENESEQELRKVGHAVSTIILTRKPPRFLWQFAREPNGVRLTLRFMFFRRKWQKLGARPSRGTGKPHLEMHRSRSAIQECLMIEFIGQFQLPEFQACLQSRKRGCFGGHELR